jgi:hypothetical protein
MQRGFLYLAVFPCATVVCLQTMRGIDEATCETLVWRHSSTLGVSFCVDVLNEATAQYGSHSNRTSENGKVKVYPTSGGTGLRRAE